MSLTIPICFYPMQKIFIDDDKAFMQSIMLKMYNQNFKAFNSPTIALNYLKNEYNPTFSMTDLINTIDSAEDSTTRQTINFDIKKLKSLLANKHVNDLSVLLIDYHMPEMFGTDFLREIADLPFKKALITGERDYTIGINAFNDGLVDAYIRKDEPNFLAKLQSVVNDLEWKYYIDLSKIVNDLPGNNFKYLHNKKFIQTFMDFIDTNDVVGYCLIDMNGSFLTKDSNDNYKYFLVRTSDQLSELSITVKEDGGTIETINDLENSKSIPFFYDKDSWEVPGKEWDKYLHNANAINETSLCWTAIDCAKD